jgi:hypothetical protein
MMRAMADTTNMHSALTGAGVAPHEEELTIAGRTMRSRLLLGSGGFPSLELLSAAIAAAGSELVTVALRRIDPRARGSLVDVLAQAGVELLPNTAGCYTARDAACLRRDAEALEHGHDRLASLHIEALAVEHDHELTPTGRAAGWRVPVAKRSGSHAASSRSASRGAATPSSTPATSSAVSGASRMPLR